MEICVVGWHYEPSIYETLSAVRKKYPVTVIAHRESSVPSDFGVPAIPRENTGLEFGAYDYYLRNVWDKSSDVFFLHDDSNAGLSSFRKIAALGRTGADQAYINFDRGGHGRAIWMSGRILQWLLKRECRECSFCKRQRDRYNPENPLPALNPHSGFFYDPFNTGHTTGKPPEGVRHFNSAVSWFHSLMEDIRTGVEPNAPFSVLNRLVVPEMDLFRRGVPEALMGTSAEDRNRLGIAQRGLRGGDRLKPGEDPFTVYTVLTGNYDRLNPIGTQSPDIRFVCFTDCDLPDNLGWEIIRMGDIGVEDPRRASRHPKMLPHRYFPGQDTLYIDANMRPVADFLPFIRKRRSFRPDVDWTTVKHERRHCVYTEAEHCRRLALDDPEKITAQILKYQRAGYPYNAGLYECNWIFRKDNPKVRALSEAWWQEYMQGSRRDQISFPFVLKDSAVKMDLLTEAERNKLVRIMPHR